MLKKLWLTIASIRNYDRIPKLPRGMLATKYTKLTQKEREVLARLGARDPVGIKVAMRRYKVKSIDELMTLLEHQQPKRRVGERWWLALGRLMGGYGYDPHASAIAAEARRSQRPKQVILEDRLKSAVKAFREE